MGSHDHAEINGKTHFALRQAEFTSPVVLVNMSSRKAL